MLLYERQLGPGDIGNLGDFFVKWGPISFKNDFINSESLPSKNPGVSLILTEVSWLSDFTGFSLALENTGTERSFSS